MSENRLQRWAAIAEIIGALAIIVSLLYVGYEVRRTQTVSNREADLTLFQRGSEELRMIIESPDIAQLIVTARSAPEDLTPADSLRYLAFQHHFFDTWEVAWYYRVDGILNEATFRDWDAWFSRTARDLPRFAWTENRRNFTGPDFVAHVERALGGS